MFRALGWALRCQLEFSSSGVQVSFLGFRCSLTLKVFGSKVALRVHGLGFKSSHQYALLYRLEEATPTPHANSTCFIGASVQRFCEVGCKLVIVVGV